MNSPSRLQRIMRSPLGTVAGAAALVVTLIVGNPGWPVLLLCALFILVPEWFYRFRTQPFTPYPLLLLSPALLLVYSSRGDFTVRVLTFVMLLMFTAAAAASGSRLQFSLARWRLGAVWLLAFIVLAGAAFVLQQRRVHLSGDEPHFLMISQSVVDDGDFDLKNNIEQKTYFRYLPVEIEFHGGVYQGKWLSYHMPGVSFLMVPFYWLYAKMNGVVPPQLFFRLAAALVNSFFALGLFLLLRRRYPRSDTGGLWLFFLLTFPLLFHAVHLYPELPAGAFLLFAVLAVEGQRPAYGRAGLFLALTWWFHVKYYPALGIFALIVAWRLLKERNVGGLLRFALPSALSMGLLALYCHQVYGFLSPTNIFPAANYAAIPHSLQWGTWAAFFFDQRDGLLFYAPIFFFLFAGLSRGWSRHKSAVALLFLYTALHAFTTIRGAYSPAARPLMFLIWVPMLLVAEYRYGEDAPRGRFFFRLGGALTLFVTLWMLYHPLLEYQPVTAATTERASSLLRFFGSDTIDLPSFFPSFLKIVGANRGYIPNYVWLLGALLLLIFGLRRRTRQSMVRPGLVALGLVAATALLCIFPHLYLLPSQRQAAASTVFYNRSRNFVYNPEGDIFRLKCGESYDLYFDPAAGRADALTLRFTNPEAGRWELYNGRRRLFSGDPSRPEVTLSLRSLPSFPHRGRRLVHIGLETRAAGPSRFLFLTMRPGPSGS